MRRRTFLIALAVLLAAAYLAGRLANHSAVGPGGSADRKVLYYVDPMNPAFHSPEPGTAPCGMPLEPVFAGSPAPGGGSSATSPGVVQVRPDRLQLIGVAREQIQPRTVRHTLRLVGTVAPDESRLFTISAASPGRALEMGTATTGSAVARGQVLGAYYAQELIVPQQNFIRLREATEALRRTGVNPYDNLQGGTQAAKGSNQPYKVYLCKYFWLAPMKGTDSQAGTLIHEVSHFYVVAGTDDYVYVQAGAKNLAITNPNDDCQQRG